jgi:hypothetical protein
VLGLHLLQCCEHFHSHDFVTSACCLHNFRWNDKRTELWRPHTNRGVCVGFREFPIARTTAFSHPC